MPRLLSLLLAFSVMACTAPQIAPAAIAQGSACEQAVAYSGRDRGLAMLILQDGEVICTSAGRDMVARTAANRNVKANIPAKTDPMPPPTTMASRDISVFILRDAPSASRRQGLQRRAGTSKNPRSNALRGSDAASCPDCLSRRVCCVRRWETRPYRRFPE